MTWVLEEVIPSETPPRVACIAGERKCPPEDCGGTWGYQTLLEAMAEPSHEQHDEMMRWIGGSFDPEDFDPQQVRFDNPKERWNRAFEQS
ncbi:MAG: plasmid pRiA4b ORF-3 family protein [Woeseiaceae bacterium]